MDTLVIKVRRFDIWLSNLLLRFERFRWHRSSWCPIAIAAKRTTWHRHVGASSSGISFGPNAVYRTLYKSSPEARAFIYHFDLHGEAKPTTLTFDHLQGKKL
jgi:hypothetical protein